VTAVRSVLMGNPEHFSVQGGANPHTRTRWGTKRSVDREAAIRQWHGLKDVLQDLGLRVLVVPPDPDWPGSVYPANAGFQSDVDADLPLSGKVFRLSNLLPTRAGEKPIYEGLLREAGYRVESIDEQFRFEGEADFFPAGDVYLLTHGRVEQQRFAFRLGLPPWKRIYGFRTDVRVAEVLEPVVAPKPVLKIALTLEAHYHGDTALCAFGPGRQQLLAYRAAIDPGDWKQLEARFGDALIELGDEDAERYAANSFTYTSGSGADSVLVMPGGISQRLLDQIREREVRPLTVDVSEFLKKGGGSVKCMIGDLGVVGSEVLADS
jgi:N-dimethylarginine dimethylaminohydrolase